MSVKTKLIAALKVWVVIYPSITRPISYRSTVGSNTAGTAHICLNCDISPLDDFYRCSIIGIVHQTIPYKETIENSGIFITTT
jgi:hypothetical protein